MTSLTELLGQAESLKPMSVAVQDDAKPQQEREGSLVKLGDLYHQWYRQALQCFQSAAVSDGKLRFESEYEGSIFANKILAFLTQGLQISPFYKPETPNPLIPKWLCPATQCFVKPLTKQCNYLSALESNGPKRALGASTEWNNTICRIFHAFLDKAEAATSNQQKKWVFRF